MGVHGLWRLIEPAGKPVPLETLENKVLAVDVSIWLHQAIKGFQDSKGAPVPNAHLLGIYHRVTKLLYFKIKPIFIFDGGVPVLKKQTIARRNQLKSRNASEADRLQKQLLNTILKHSAINKVLSEKTKVSIAAHAKRSNRPDMYLLPVPEHDPTLSSSESEEDSSSTTETPDSSPTKHWDLHTIDMSSNHFKSLPIEVRHEILTDLKDTRKQSSWGRIQEIPKQSDDFSSYQMKRLLKRQSVQSALDQVAQEMGGSSLSLAELEMLFKDQGIPTTNDKGKRIASDENIKYFYIKDVKEAIDKARKEHLDREISTKNDINPANEEHTPETTLKTKADQEEEEELQKAIALSLQEVPSTSEMSKQKTKFQFSFHDDRDFHSDSSCEEIKVPFRTKTSDRTHNIISKSSEEQNKPFDKNNGAEFESHETYQSKNDILEAVIKDNGMETIVGNKSVLQNLSRDLQLKYNCEASKGTVNENDVNKRSYFSIETPQYIGENVLLESDKDESYIPIKNTSPIHPKDVDAINKNDHIEEITSDSSDSNNFMEVSDVELIKDSVIEIEIDPSKEKEDDLFADIFDISEGLHETKSLQIGINTENVGFSFSNVEEKKSLDSLKMKDDASKSEPKIVRDQANVENKIQNDMLEISEKVDRSYEQSHSLNVNKEENSRINENTIETNTVDNQKRLEKVEDAVIATVEPVLSLSEMEDLRNKLQIEKTDILVEKSIKERMASNITDQMYEEAQELLELFGVPYIIAPMEAEAQCAFLDAMELTDGTITDDSDIWLFGGKTVYKNFFNQSKYVMEFRAEDIQHNFKLSREQMILLALLVGSDYTTGIQGVGPVTALEILASFPPSQSTELCLSHNQLLSGLKEFKSWFNKGKREGVCKTVLKNKLNNITFTETFPSQQVVEAYLNPKVETSKETFSWTKPDIIALSVFAKVKFGWSSKKTDEILNPVVKRLEESHSQKSIRDYFKTKIKVRSGSLEGKISKRVKSALGQFGKTREELISEEIENLEKKQKKIRTKTKLSTEEKSEQKIDQKKKKSRTKKGIKKNISQNQESEQNNKIEDAENNQELQQNDEKKDIENQESKEIKTKLEYPKRTRKRNNNKIEDTKPTKIRNIDEPKPQTNEPNLMETEDIKTDDAVDELKLYEGLAAELKIRRQKKNEMQSKNKLTKWQKQKKAKKILESIPKELKEHEDVQVLLATTSRSVQRVEEIHKEVEQSLEKPLKKNPESDVSNTNLLRKMHNKEIIHQKLKDNTDLLRNKMKAIEVFRRSKKGPGFVGKRPRTRQRPKQDAGLSEDSDG